MNSPKTIRSVFSKEEIMLSDVWSLFWTKRKYLFICIAIFAIIGFIAAKTTPKAYTASCVLLGEEAGGGGSSAGVQALAGLAGINTASSGGGLADLYPIILANQTFLVELSKETIYQDDNNPTTLYQYFQKPLEQDAITNAKMFIADLPNTIGGWFKSTPKTEVAAKPSIVAPPVKMEPAPVQQGPKTTIESLAKNAITPLGDSITFSVVKLSGQDIRISTILRSRIKLTQNGREVSLAVTMPEARLSAEAAKLVLNKMIQYVIKYKTNKQLQNLNFLEARAAEANATYKNNQQKVAGFNDKNYGVVYQSVKAQESQLQNEYNITFNTYNQLAAQLEQARIDLKKQTPLFTILQPVYIPSGPASVDTTKTIIMNIAIGAVLGLTIIFVLLAISYVREGKTIKRTMTTTIE